jgi:hypothetical protein
MICAQLIHAAGESSPGDLHPGTYAIALAVPDEPALKQLAERLEAQGVPIHRIVESEGLFAGQLMAIGVKPGLKSERGQFLSTLSLLKMSALKEHHNEDLIWNGKLRVLNRDLEKARNRIVELEQERPLTWTQRFKRWWRKEQVA